MNSHFPAEDDSEYIEDIPPIWVKLVAQRAIFRAQVRAKITGRAHQPMRIICKFTPSASLSKWLDEDPDCGLKLGRSE